MKEEKTAAVEGQQQEVLNDDELYAKIQTEKLLKKKKKRKIITIASMAVALAIAVCVIVLAAVPVSLKPRCLKGKFSEVRMYEGTQPVASFTETDERYDRFVKAFDKSFSKTYLTALFSGSLFSYDINELHDTNTTLANIAAMAGSENRLVRLTYDTPQKLTTQNGKDYVSNRKADKWGNWKLTFTDVYVVINAEEGLKTTTIYVLAEYPTFTSGEIDGSETRLVELTVKADTNVLYKQWNKIITK